MSASPSNGNYTLTLWRHCVHRNYFDAQDDDGAAFDLTGWDAEAHVRSKLGDTLVLELTIMIDAPETGRIEMSATEEETAELTVGEYRWDLTLISPLGERLAPSFLGPCFVKSPVTHPPD